MSEMKTCKKHGVPEEPMKTGAYDRKESWMCPKCAEEIGKILADSIVKLPVIKTELKP